MIFTYPKLSSYDPTSENLDRSVSKWMAPRPCDRCRQKRIRCDRDLYQCNHCNRHDEKCTYTYKCKKRGPRSKLDKDIERYNNNIVNTQKYKEIVFINNFKDLSVKDNKNKLSDEVLFSDKLGEDFIYQSHSDIKNYHEYSLKSYQLSNNQPL